MTCSEAERILPGYLDGAVAGPEHANLRKHLDSCAACRRDLELYRLLSMRLGRVEAVRPPAELAMQIRVNASKSYSLGRRLEDVWATIRLEFENIVRPFAVPATGGLLTALAVFVLLVQNILVGVPLGGIVPNDLPLNLVEPARLESLAPFPVPGVMETADRHDSGALLLEATLNSSGQVVYYKIISGPSNAVVQHQIDQLLLFSRFRPQLNFGLPMNGGRVLLNFSEVLVRG